MPAWTSHRPPDDRGGLRGSLWLFEPWDGYAHLKIGLWWWSRYVHAFSLLFVVGGEDREVGVTFSLWRFFVHLALADVFPQAFCSRVWAWAEDLAERETKAKSGTWAHDLHPFNHARETGFSAHDGCVWFFFWRNRMGGWSSHKALDWPWKTAGWEGVVCWFDFLFGASVYEKGDAEGRPLKEDVYVILPEGRYPATVTYEQVRWRRRWWSTGWLWRTQVDVPGGLPIPGKGENAHDCDDDATYAISYGAERDPIPEWVAVERLALDVLKTRSTRAGLAWTPREGWPPHCERPEVNTQSKES